METSTPPPKKGRIGEDLKLVASWTIVKKVYLRQSYLILKFLVQMQTILKKQVKCKSNLKWLPTSFQEELDLHVMCGQNVERLRWRISWEIPEHGYHHGGSLDHIFQGFCSTISNTLFSFSMLYPKRTLASPQYCFVCTPFLFSYACSFLLAQL